MKKLILIGGGVAGLTAGIYAADAGAACTLVEKNGSGAGALCGWRREGFEIDGCLHWLTGTKEGTELYGIWQKTGMLDGGIVKTDAFFSSETDGVRVTFYRDAKKTEEEMESLSPGDVPEIRKFFRAVKAASSLSETEEEPLGKAECALSLAPFALLSAGEVAERFKSPVIKRTICDLTGEYYSSLGLIFAYAAYSSGNGFLPRGGSRGAAQRMVEKFKSLGGEYISGKSAVKVERRGDGYAVTLSDGGVVKGDRILCCADPVKTVASLFGAEYLPQRYMKKLLRKDKYPLFSSVHFAFSAKRDDVPFRGTLFIPCRCHEIGSVNRDRLMLREFSHEPSFAPDGMSVIQTMSFTDEEKSRKWMALSDDKEAYREAKKDAADEIKERIAERFPSLSGVGLIDSWTPATYSRCLGSLCGSYMSFALTPATAPAAFPTRLRGLDGVYFASGWTRSPGGVPNAALAGRNAALSVIG